MKKYTTPILIASLVLSLAGNAIQGKQNSNLKNKNSELQETAAEMVSINESYKWEEIWLLTSDDPDYINKITKAKAEAFDEFRNIIFKFYPEDYSSIFLR